jgi:quercetin dioxygenase-like cupin family protein
MQKKNLNKPDETRTPPKTKVEVVKIGDNTVMRTTFEPGWKWSDHVKPTAGTDSCQAHHVIYAISGQMKVVMNDGSEMDVVPGDVVDIPPGHDAWVVGDEAAVGIDFGGATNYAKPAAM